MFVCFSLFIVIDNSAVSIQKNIFNSLILFSNSFMEQQRNKRKEKSNARVRFPKKRTDHKEDSELLEAWAMGWGTLEWRH